jgi:hypothetical protein
MVAVMCVVALMSQASSGGHVRAMDPRILPLIDWGLSRSATFRSLIAMLEDSDVIVYVDAKRGRQALGGYLTHNIVTSGRYRYLHAAVDRAVAWWRFSRTNCSMLWRSRKARTPAMSKPSSDCSAASPCLGAAAAPVMRRRPPRTSKTSSTRSSDERGSISFSPAALSAEP